MLPLQANKVSCVGVISHSAAGGLAASLSSSDLRGLLPEHFVALGAPVLQYLTAKASASWPAQQHAVFKPSRHVPASPHGAKPLPPQMHAQGQQQQEVDQVSQHPQQQNTGQPQRVGSAYAWGLKVNLLAEARVMAAACTCSSFHRHLQQHSNDLTVLLSE